MTNPARTTIGSYERFPLCKAVKAAGLVFCSGQVPMTDDGEIVAGGIGPQARFVLEQLVETLKLAGSEPMDVVKVNIILADKRDFPEFNTIYREFFPVDPPARTSICATLLVDARIEIELIALAR
ncbi:RidA family protein [Phenylobacterium sp. LH3H17]|uniref:RidA family protein n=1 Tax=Phenylobacterium sp. LH3H17 TaxID=2903901 RepID=UPI0020C9FD55|nr:RidA family protein [Phenylobacterium sp. LH3H17]UTP38280.1 RidA family protein [Phenylobacterium sp. LH3H17]